MQFLDKLAFRHAAMLTFVVVASVCSACLALPVRAIVGVKTATPNGAFVARHIVTVGFIKAWLATVLIFGALYSIPLAHKLFAAGATSNLKLCPRLDMSIFPLPCPLAFTRTKVVLANCAWRNALLLITPIALYDCWRVQTFITAMVFCILLIAVWKNFKGFATVSAGHLYTITEGKLGTIKAAIFSLLCLSRRDNEYLVTLPTDNFNSLLGARPEFTRSKFIRALARTGELAILPQESWKYKVFSCAYRADPRHLLYFPVHVRNYTTNVMVTQAIGGLLEWCARFWSGWSQRTGSAEPKQILEAHRKAQKALRETEADAEQMQMELK